jgi:hypothetical protein
MRRWAPGLTQRRAEAGFLHSSHSLNLLTAIRCCPPTSRGMSINWSGKQPVDVQFPQVVALFWLSVTTMRHLILPNGQVIQVPCAGLWKLQPLMSVFSGSASCQMTLRANFRLHFAGSGKNSRFGSLKISYPFISPLRY